MTHAGALRRALIFGVASLLAFVTGLAVWFPAGLALRALPAPYSCAEPGGTLWRGRCADLRHGDTRLGAVSWTLRALPLVTGRVAADVAWSAIDSRVSARVDARLSGRASLRDLRGDIDVIT
ncbi:MAG: type II secretion system protein N, partial [Gammaproteobacteria bacterium]